MPISAIRIVKISTSISATGSNCLSIQTLTMSYVSRLLMPIGKGKIQAKLDQERIKISIYLIYLDFLSGMANKKDYIFLTHKPKQ
jgi:hypothetical protein